MSFDNKIILLRKEIITNIARLCFNDKLLEDIDKLPQQIIKKDDKESFRCCIYKDRELIKQRIIAALGFSLEMEDCDENFPSFYANIALHRNKIEEPILTFIDEACKSCVKSNYVITNICKNCVAKNCMTNCPKKSISIEDGKASINPEICINCGICLKVCPYHAIAYVPIPCEESCPTGAIKKNSSGKEEIDYGKCIFCGKCLKSCPFGAIEEKSQIVDIIQHIKTGGKTIAIIAPSIVGQFEGGLFRIVSALKKLGFSNVVEVALGADITACEEGKEITERIKRGDKLMGTSCCPSYIEAVKKHNPDFLPYVSHAKTPMIYTAEIAKKTFPDSAVVFIGPCIGKIHESVSSDLVDYALTFEELSSVFSARNIGVGECEETKPDIDIAHNIGRIFPISGNVAKAIMKQSDGNVKLDPVLINGFSRQNIKILSSYATGKCPGNIVEVMSCEGGCIAGSGIIAKPQLSVKRINELINKIN
jgi:[FeFe] hydrogenase (group B1/B3)